MQHSSSIQLLGFSLPISRVKRFSRLTRLTDWPCNHSGRAALDIGRELDLSAAGYKRPPKIIAATHDVGTKRSLKPLGNTTQSTLI